MTATGRPLAIPRNNAESPSYRHCERSEAIHKENPLAENAESAESLKDSSDFIDSSDKINQTMDLQV